MAYNEHYEEIQVISEKVIKTTAKNWKVYPSNRITVEHVPYSWTLDNGTEYSWTKVRIKNQKLTTENWETVNKKKVQWKYAVDDKKETDMKLEEFIEMCNDSIENLKWMDL